MNTATKVEKRKPKDAAKFSQRKLAAIYKQAENTTIGDALKILNARMNTSDMRMSGKLFRVFKKIIRADDKVTPLRAALTALVLASSTFYQFKVEEFNAGISPRHK
jgi:hypothetical protein